MVCALPRVRVLQGVPNMDEDGFQAAMARRPSHNQAQELRRSVLARWRGMHPPRSEWGAPG